MPSRKQRRRRAKERRHEWEEVWVDDEGNELEAPPDDDAPARAERRAAGPARRQPATRAVQPPSWRRVGKRALIFGPVMFLLVSFVSSELTLTERIVQAAMLIAFFLPFSYFMDSLMYRMFMRRSAGAVGRKT